MMNVTITTLKIPVKQIQNAILTVRDAHDKLIDLEHERAALGTVEAVRLRAGEEGITRRQVALEAIDERWGEIVAEAERDVDEQAHAAVEMIDKQVTPDGADIIGVNEGDFALIRNGLIANPAQLSRILARHDNTAFRLAAQRYAADPAREWEGFNFLDKENSLREYTEQVFNNLKTAAGRPHGVAYSQYANTPGEFQRIAVAYDLATEFEASGGNDLEKIYG